MLDVNPKETFAVLVGFSRFDKDPKAFPELPHVRNNLADMVAALTDPEILGVPVENIASLPDATSTDDIIAAILERGNQAANGTLLFYYAGHGVPRQGGLVLATSKTTVLGADVNGLRFDLVRDSLKKSTAPHKIVVLDCCFSGMAIEGLTMAAAEDELTASVETLTGAFAMTASAPTSVAIAPEGERNTAFTGALLQTLRAGVPAGPTALTLGDVFNQTRRRLVEDRRDLPEPRKASFGELDDLRVVRNRAALQAADPVAALSTRVEELASAVAQLQARPVVRQGDTARGSTSAPSSRVPRLLRACGSVAVIGLHAIVPRLWLSQMHAYNTDSLGRALLPFLLLPTSIVVLLAWREIVVRSRGRKGHTLYDVLFGQMSPTAVFRVTLVSLLVGAAGALLAFLDTAY